jgi:phage FluMu gp28-like protein
MPSIRAAFERAKEQVSELSFRQEWLAEFVSAAGSVFRNVRQHSRLPELQGPEEGRQYFIGVDWGMVSDFTVIVVCDDTGRIVTLDRFNQIPYTLQAERLASMVEVWQPQAVVAEENAMAAHIQRMAEDYPDMPLIPFRMTAQSKPKLIGQFQTALEKGDIKLLDSPILLHELEAFEAKVRPNGTTDYGAGGSNHDDTVIAAALSWHAVNTGGRQVQVEQLPVRRNARRW